MSKPKKQKTEFDPKELREERIRLIHAHLEDAQRSALAANVSAFYAFAIFDALVKGES